jgi:predicted TIM-barrel fold metal-dependent hydrolase
MAAIGNSSRREFIGALSAGVAAAGAVATTPEAMAQGGASLKIVDFHNHMGPSWTLTNLANVPPPARPAWEKINANLQSESALIASVESAGVAARVINTPTAFIEDADGKAPAGETQRINDRMAEVCAKHPGKLYGLATVDAFSGDAGARELTRAVKELRLRGVFVESARGDLLLGADHVLMGTDWPIVEEKSVRERLEKAFAHSGLNAAEQQMVAGGNALRLLGVA